MTSPEQFFDELSLQRAEGEGMFDRRVPFVSQKLMNVSSIQLMIADDEGMMDQRSDREYLSSNLIAGESVTLISS